jgi:hypothetical protein
MNCIVVLLLTTIVLFIFFNKNVENFENYNLGSHGNYPSSVSEVLLEDSFPIKNKLGITNVNESKIWWHYPIFKVGSYTQINNNLKYPNNPDTARCMPSNFCGSLYKEQQIKSNISNVLPPVESSGGVRVNYYNS